MATPAGAKLLPPWGSKLANTPTLDTANGASHANAGRSTQRAIRPSPHDGSDLATWNTRIAEGSSTAPSPGQVRTVKLKGCAVKDNSAPNQLSAGTPVNTILFQTLARQPNGSYRVQATAPGFRLPFCSNSRDTARGRINTSTITAFHPVHLCIARGQTVALYDIGGFIPNPHGLPWYPQGVPFKVIARIGGSSMSSFVDADISHGLYAPGSHPRGAGGGWGVEPGEQLMLQVGEGTGGDAYALCPGGTANEPANSNQVLCVYRRPYDGHRRCSHAAQDQHRVANRAVHLDFGV